MWLYIALCKRFDDTFKNAQWRKKKQMQPMWQCILSGRPFENTFDNTQWRKAKQVQSMWILILFYKRFEDPFQNTQWRKVKQIQPMWFCIASWGSFEFEEFCFEYLNLFCQQELPVLIGVQLVPGIIKSKGWLAIATLKPTFTFLGRDFAIFKTFTWQNPYQKSESWF